MPELHEFFIPNKVADLEDENKVGRGRYFVDLASEFDVPSGQQLDDLARLFDSLHREKSPTALFSKPELFFPLFTYVKGISNSDPSGTQVTRASRHKICHEVGERMKKLLQVSNAFLKKRKEEGTSSAKNDANSSALEMCLRSTLKMYAFTLCHTLLGEAPAADEDDAAGGASQQRNARGNRRRRRDASDSGFGDDGSGVDMDGRELALTSLIELSSPEITSLWPNNSLEDTTLHLMLKMALRMMTQRANIGTDAQSIAGGLALLLARVTNSMLAKNENMDATDLVAPMVELSLKSDSAALFLSKFVSDLELEESTSPNSDRVMRALFESISKAALYEASTDAAAAKNIAIFFSEVSKRSVSVTVKMADMILPALQSESYDVRKSVITCIAEMIIQRYTGPSRSAADDAVRNRYLNELLFRVMDLNPFARNHVLHTWEKLVDAKAVPKRYHLALTEAIVGRLEDRNYLVRDSAMIAISGILRRNWFGHVLNGNLVKERLADAVTEAAAKFSTHDLFEAELEKARRQFQPPAEETNLDPLREEEEEEGDADESGDSTEVTSGPSATTNRAEEETGRSNTAGVKKEEHSQKDASKDSPIGAREGSQGEVELTYEQIGLINKVLFYECTLAFIQLSQRALHHACVLLDSRTERDVVEAIKLVVTCSEYRLEGGEKAFLKVLVMVFEGEVKIQLAVRDAFIEVIFNAFNRLSNSAVTRATASAQKLISVLREATEGEVSAVDRIFGLLKVNPTLARLISGQFVEAVWGIAEGSLDQAATVDDRRTAMHIYSLLSKYCWKDVHARKDSILEFLDSRNGKDNVLLSYVFTALQNESLDPHFRPIPAATNPKGHPVLKHLVTHLCRKTTAIASWMCLAEAAVNAVHHLCEVPVVIYTYILEYLGAALSAEGGGSRSDDPNSKAQLHFLVGLTALKQLVAVESAERQQIKALEESAQEAAAPHSNGGGKGRGGATEEDVSGGADSMHKELGIGSHEFRRHAIQELAVKRRQAIVAEGSLWNRYAKDVVAVCEQKTTSFQECPFERVCAVLALCELMIVDEAFCQEHLSLLFAIVADKRESWVVKTNIVIALGDLACVHPNLLGPYLSVPTTGFFKMLADDDLRVRAVTIQVCSHLVLGEMLRIRDHLYTIVKLVADPDEGIASNAVTFVQNLAMKEKEKTGNLIPPLVTQLSGIMPADKFQLAMRTLLERVEGDKPTDSLIERLCQRFDSYSERSKKKHQLARNLAFCLSELSYTTERVVKRVMSEPCYQQYKLWLRDAEVFDYFKQIATKAKKQGRFSAERRDKSSIEEWESRMAVDACRNPAEEEAAREHVAEHAYDYNDGDEAGGN